MNMDFSKLAPVSAHKRKEAKYDLQYRPKTGKWRVSDLAFARNGLNTMGFNLLLHPDDGYVVFQLVDENEAQLLRRRANTENKGLEFTSDVLRTLLDSKFKGVNDFRLTDLGEHSGNAYVGIEPWSEEMEVTVTTKVETVVDEDDDETKEMVDAVAEEAKTAEVSDDVNNVAPLSDQETEEGDDPLDFSTGQETKSDDSKDLDLEDIPEKNEEPVTNPFSKI